MKNNEDIQQAGFADSLLKKGKETALALLFALPAFGLLLAPIMDGLVSMLGLEPSQAFRAFTTIYFCTPLLLVLLWGFRFFSPVRDSADQTSVSFVTLAMLVGGGFVTAILIMSTIESSIILTLIQISLVVGITIWLLTRSRRHLIEIEDQYYYELSLPRHRRQREIRNVMLSQWNFDYYRLESTALGLTLIAVAVTVLQLPWESSSILWLAVFLEIGLLVLFAIIHQQVSQKLPDGQLHSTQQPSSSNPLEAFYKHLIPLILRSVIAVPVIAFILAFLVHSISERLQHNPNGENAPWSAQQFANPFISTLNDDLSRESKDRQWPLYTADSSLRERLTATFIASGQDASSVPDTTSANTRKLALRIAYLDTIISHLRTMDKDFAAAAYAQNTGVALENDRRFRKSRTLSGLHRLLDALSLLAGVAGNNRDSVVAQARAECRLAIRKVRTAEAQRALLPIMQQTQRHGLLIFLATITILLWYRFLVSRRTPAQARVSTTAIDGFIALLILLLVPLVRTIKEEDIQVDKPYGLINTPNWYLPEFVKVTVKEAANGDINTTINQVKSDSALIIRLSRRTDTLLQRATEELRDSINTQTAAIRSAVDSASDESTRNAEEVYRSAATLENEFRRQRGEQDMVPTVLAAQRKRQSGQ